IVRRAFRPTLDAVLAVEMPFQRHMPRRAPLKSPIQVTESPAQAETNNASPNQRKPRGRPVDSDLAARKERWIAAALAMHRKDSTLTVNEIARKISLDVIDTKRPNGTIRRALNSKSDSLRKIRDTIAPALRKNT
ncbi:MAG: hypothetical protein H7838_13600, partial [Magnetococcus sp. DMHC-8]